MSVFDEAYFAARDEEQRCHRRSERHPELVLSIMRGEEALLRYCLYRVIRKASEQAMSDLVTYGSGGFVTTEAHAQRAIRWYGRLRRIQRRVHGEA